MKKLTFPVRFTPEEVLYESLDSDKLRTLQSQPSFSEEETQKIATQIDDLVNAGFKPPVIVLTSAWSGNSMIRCFPKALLKRIEILRVTLPFITVKSVPKAGKNTHITINNEGKIVRGDYTQKQFENRLTNAVGVFFTGGIKPINHPSYLPLRKAAIRILETKTPVFGICFGLQLLMIAALAKGIAKTHNPIIDTVAKEEFLTKIGIDTESLDLLLNLQGNVVGQHVLKLTDAGLKTGWYPAHKRMPMVPIVCNYVWHTHIEKIDGLTITGYLFGNKSFPNGFTIPGYPVGAQLGHFEIGPWPEDVRKTFVDGKKVSRKHLENLFEPTINYITSLHFNLINYKITGKRLKELTDVTQMMPKVGNTVYPRILNWMADWRNTHK